MILVTPLCDICCDMLYKVNYFVSTKKHTWMVGEKWDIVGRKVTLVVD